MDRYLESALIHVIKDDSDIFLEQTEIQFFEFIEFILFKMPKTTAGQDFPETPIVLSSQLPSNSATQLVICKRLLKKGCLVRFQQHLLHCLLRRLLYLLRHLWHCQHRQ